MRKDTSEMIKQWFPIISRIVTPVGVMLIALMMSTFASKDELSAIKDEITEIKKILAVRAEQQKRSDAMADKIDRIESELHNLALEVAKQR